MTGIRIEAGRILLVRQRLSGTRDWSLPGGRPERGETLTRGLTREFKEETGPDVRLDKLLCLCDAEPGGHTLLHVTFSVTRAGGEITLPNNEFDMNPIHDVRFVPMDELVDCGFSDRFARLARQGFPQAGGYMSDKRNIGLGL